MQRWAIAQRLRPEPRAAGAGTSPSRSREIEIMGQTPDIVPGSVLEPRLGRHRKTATLALLAFAMLIVSLDQYIVDVALPEIGRDLGYSAQTLQSVISAYTVASSSFLLLGGRAADLVGRRRTLVAGLAFYASASLAGGLATTPVMLLTARVVQGFGGALVFPATLSLVNTMFPEGRERNWALAVWGGAGASGLVVGVLLGGLLTYTFGWEAVRSEERRVGEEWRLRLG